MHKVIKLLMVKPDSGRLNPSVDIFTSGVVRDGVDTYVPVSDEAIIDLALKILAQRVTKGSLLSSPSMVRNYLRLRFADLEHEVFCLLYVDLCGAAVYAETLHYSAALA